MDFNYRYNTRSNKTRIVKTPGGELRLLHLKKKASAPKCGDCGIKLPGVSTLFYALDIWTSRWNWIVHDGWELEKTASIFTRGFASMVADKICLDPRPPSPRVLPDLPPQEERQPCLRWLPLRRLRQGSHCPRVPDRGAEDREEGPQGVSGEGWQALNGVTIRC